MRGRIYHQIPQNLTGRCAYWIMYDHCRKYISQLSYLIQHHCSYRLRSRAVSSPTEIYGQCGMVVRSFLGNVAMLHADVRNLWVSFVVFFLPLPSPILYFQIRRWNSHFAKNCIKPDSGCHLRPIRPLIMSLVSPINLASMGSLAVKQTIEGGLDCAEW